MNPITAPGRALFAGTPAGRTYKRLPTVAFRYSSAWNNGTTPDSLAKFDLVCFFDFINATAATTATRINAMAASARAVGNTGQLRCGYVILGSANLPTVDPSGDYGYGYPAPGDKVEAENWWLREIAGFPTGTKLATFGASVPDINYGPRPAKDSQGRSWPRVYADMVDYAIKRSGIGHLVHGFFMDNSQLWPVSAAGDWRQDGSANLQCQNQAETRDYSAGGHREFWDRLRALRPSWKLIANSSRGPTQAQWFAQPQVAGQADGNLAEHMSGSYVLGLAGTPMQTAGFSQANGGSSNSAREVFTAHVADGAEWTIWWANVSPSTDYQAARFGMCAAWILGGQPHIRPPAAADPIWYDEFDAELGEPIDAVPTAKVVGTTNVWMRRYQNGCLILNGSSYDTATYTALTGTPLAGWGRHPGEVATITSSVLPYGIYKHISGTQDFAANPGTVINSSWSLQPWDARVLLCVTPGVHS
jgi:hypothetical protein